MPTLSIDIETFSEVDLPKAGVYAYTDNDTFEILLFAYAFDSEPTQIVDLKCGERLPRRVLEALTDLHTPRLLSTLLLSVPVYPNTSVCI